MRIVKLQAENVKRLKAVEITPEGDVVVISGRNGQGKSSVLDAIWFALGGKDAQRGTQRPVRDGADRATVTLDLGDLTVTRTWSSNEKSTLKVEAKDGARYSSPQAVLDKLVGDLSFDPLTFAQLPERQQRDRLLELVGVDLDAIDRERKVIFDERTQVNGRVKELAAQSRGYNYPSDTPVEEVAVADVVTSLNNAKDWQHLVNTKTSELAAVRRRIQELDSMLLTARADEAELTEWLNNRVPDPLPDPAVYQRQLEELDTTNRNVRARQQHERVTLQLEAAESLAQSLTDHIAQVDARKIAALDEAQLPVTGLGFDADGVTFQGVPLKQASSAEQLRVSVAVAMALNPELRVVRITDGSLLDSGSMKVIEDLAREHDFQVWVEVVDESGTVGVYVEDGEVRDGTGQ